MLPYLKQEQCSQSISNLHVRSKSKWRRVSCSLGAIKTNASTKTKKWSWVHFHSLRGLSWSVWSVSKVPLEVGTPLSVYIPLERASRYLYLPPTHWMLAARTAANKNHHHHHDEPIYYASYHSPYNANIKMIPWWIIQSPMLYRLVCSDWAIILTIATYIHIRRQRLFFTISAIYLSPWW